MRAIVWNVDTLDDLPRYHRLCDHAVVSRICPSAAASREESGPASSTPPSAPPFSSSTDASPVSARTSAGLRGPASLAQREGVLRPPSAGFLMSGAKLDVLVAVCRRSVGRGSFVSSTLASVPEEDLDDSPTAGAALSSCGAWCRRAQSFAGTRRTTKSQKMPITTTPAMARNAMTPARAPRGDASSEPVGEREPSAGCAYAEL